MALSDIEKLQRQVGKKIKALRLEKNIKQQELAAACDLEKTHLSRIEAGGQNLTLKMMLRIAKAMEIDVKDMF